MMMDLNSIKKGVMLKSDLGERKVHYRNVIVLILINQVIFML
jgi:hypothetical protein